MHNMGLKWPVFISYVISVMDECFFAESLKEMFFYHLLVQIDKQKKTVFVFTLILHTWVKNDPYRNLWYLLLFCK